jgi:hypothetical protein
MSVVLDFDPPFMRSQATNEAHGAIERLAFLVVQRATRKQAATNISVSELVAVVYEVTLQQFPSIRMPGGSRKAIFACFRQAPVFCCEARRVRSECHRFLRESVFKMIL